MESESELYTAAIFALARRAYSVHDMKSLLERKAAHPEQVMAILHRLRASGYLDDARYAREFALRSAKGRRQGPHRIRRELRRRGLADQHIEAAIQSAYAEVSSSTHLRNRLSSMLTRKRGPLDSRRLASLYRSLLMAGFDGDLIRRELRAAAAGSDQAANAPGEDTTDEEGDEEQRDTE